MNSANSAGSGEDAGNLPQVSHKPLFTSSHCYKMDSHVEDEIEFEEEGEGENEMAEVEVKHVGDQMDASNQSSVLPMAAIGPISSEFSSVLQQHPDSVQEKSSHEH